MSKSRTSYIGLLCVWLFIVMTTPALASQEVHPQKAQYQGAESWPVTAPGDVALKNFRPFRAVYQRNYTNHAGEPRTDRVIITAEDVGWEGHEAIAITLIDSADPEFEDTNGRTLAMYIKREDLSLLMEIGPVPGSAVDYYIARVLPDSTVVNIVTTDVGQHQFQTAATTLPGFGPGNWVIASMDLEVGMRIRLDPVYSARFNALVGFTHIGYVVGRQAYTDLTGTTYDAFSVEHAGNLANASVSRRHMVGRPPYLLGTEIVNLDNGDTRDSMRLMQFEYLGED